MVKCSADPFITMRICHMFSCRKLDTEGTGAFALHDTNGDGCLDSVEFAKLVATVAGQSDEFLGNGRAERDILHMYADASEVRSISCLVVLRVIPAQKMSLWQGAGLDDDRLEEDAFVAVCYRYDINLSPHQYDKSA